MMHVKEILYQMHIIVHYSDVISGVGRDTILIYEHRHATIVTNGVMLGY